MWRFTPARIAALVVLILGVFFLPWWLNAVLVFLFILLFSRFYEAAVAGLIFDTLYGSPAFRPWGFPLIATLGLLIAVRILEAVKKMIFFYRG